MRNTACALLALTILFPGFVFSQTITTIGEINAVDEEGNAIFAGLQTTDLYTIEGVAIVDPAAFNGELEDGSAETSFILFVEDETGGIQVYSGMWYGGGLANYPTILPGDRVRVTGLTGHFGGKTNINERHNADQKFDIEILSHGEVPAPMQVNDLAAASEFDATRQSGAEYYQGRLVVFRNVTIVGGTWEPGGTVTVQDQLGGQFEVELRYATGIGDQPQPQGALDITGVFDQEDTEAPYTGTYLLWPRSIEDFAPAASGVEDWDGYR